MLLWGPGTFPAVTQFTRTIDLTTGFPVLNWRVASAQKVLIDGKSVPSSGQQKESSGSATYKLTALNTFGSVESTLAVNGSAAGSGVKTIKPTLPPPAVRSFTILPPAGKNGNRLQWETTGAHHVSINGKPVGLSGALPIGPPHTGQPIRCLPTTDF